MQYEGFSALYSRSEHGQYPITILDIPGETSDSPSTHLYELSTPGGILRFDSARQLLINLTGHPEGRHWTFDRYFRIGKYDTHSSEISLTVLDPFLPNFEQESIVVCHGDKLLYHGDKVLGQSNDKVCHGGKTVCHGIDLATRGHEVAKLLFAGYGQYIYSHGYDPEDVLQEIYRGILVRNKGICPWDANKSSFGHYVHMVCGCVLSNYHRRQGRRTSRETVGLPPIERLDDNYSAVAGDSPEQDLIRYLQQGHQDSEVQIALRVLPWVSQGYDRKEIASKLGETPATIAKAIQFLRQATKLWSKR